MAEKEDGTMSSPGAGQHHDPDSVNDSDAISEKTLPAPKTKTKRWKGVMTGAYTEIVVASLLLIVPMLGLALILVGLVYTHLMPNNQSSYSEGDATGLPLGQAYYVNYSATRLTFVSDLSATLSTVLISMAMLLFSYPIGASLASKSENQCRKLPTPYQLSLIVDILDAKLMSFFPVLQYIGGSKKKRKPVVPDLRKPIMMLSGLCILALLINLADTWLHVAANTVLYLQMQPASFNSNFSPSRGVSWEDCESQASYSNATLAAGCPNSWEEAGDGILDSDEYIMTASNQSSFNRVLLIDGMAVLGPATVPKDTDYVASSYGSQTTCEVVTKACGTHQNINGGIDADTSFNCTHANSNMTLVGTFDQLSDGNASDYGYFPKNDLPYAPGSSSGFALLYAADSSKSNLTTDPTVSNSPDQLYWALIFALDNGFEAAQTRPSSNATTGGYDDPDQFDSLGLVGLDWGGPGGILSCTTTFFDVTYASTNTSLHLLTSPTDSNATFSQIVAANIGNDVTTGQFLDGVQLAVSSSASPRDVAHSFATTYDRTAVALTAGVFPFLPPLSQTTRIQTLVTRLPKAPFLCIVLLDLLYALLGVLLAVTALLTVVLTPGVKDAQARLAAPAMIARCFEERGFADDAKDVQELFAERRGLADVGRVGVARREEGAGVELVLVREGRGEGEEEVEDGVGEGGGPHEEGRQAS